jgi:lipopolysaccharide export system protein LptA
VILLVALAQLVAAAPAGAARPVAGTAPPPTHIEAENIEYRYKERQTVMTGKPLVILRREDATLYCRKLVADNDELGDIRIAVCDGDVKLTRGEKIVTCAHATYYAEQARIVCRGEPVLRDGPSVIACEELTYDLDQDKVFLKKPKGTLVQRPGQPLPVAKGKAQ